MRTRDDTTPTTRRATTALVATLFLAALTMAPSASAHIEECAEGEYISVPTNKAHKHEKGCEDPEKAVDIYVEAVDGANDEAQNLEAAPTPALP